jgi:signal transduction histidine kinase
MSLAILKKMEFRGDSQGVLSMDRPVISRRQERKQKSYLQRDICLALVSNELRTPTNAIVGWARLIKGGYADERTPGAGHRRY